MRIDCLGCVNIMMGAALTAEASCVHRRSLTSSSMRRPTGPAQDGQSEVKALRWQSPHALAPAASARTAIFLASGCRSLDETRARLPAVIRRRGPTRTDFPMGVAQPGLELFHSLKGRMYNPVALTANDTHRWGS